MSLFVPELCYNKKSGYSEFSQKTHVLLKKIHEKTVNF